jgi:7-carboxy-7-deazaguanine synthase
MFGANPVAKAELDGDGAELRVVDGKPFYTIQGEGPFAGQAAVFLRLHGCPLRCYFCDTEFSNPADPSRLVETLVAEIQQAGPAWVRLLVVTGGEPVRQNLSLLVEVMTGLGWTIQIETSGIMWQDCLLDTVIVCSPKTPRIHDKIYEHAHAFKYVVKEGQIDPRDGLPITNTQNETGAFNKLARPRPGVPVYLSPMDECDPVNNAKNLETVARIAMAMPYRAGVQLHKQMGLP